MRHLILRYRRSINPPWNLKDYFNLVFTFTFLLSVAFVLLSTSSSNLPFGANSNVGFFAQTALGIGETSPDLTLTITPVGNVGIGTSTPILESTPTPTPTPPTDTNLPTPAPEGSRTIHATDGTNCFDSDGNYPPYWPSGIKGYCQDNTGTYFDYCSDTANTVDYGCGGALYWSGTGTIPPSTPYMKTHCVTVQSSCPNSSCGTPVAAVCNEYSQSLQAPTPTPAFPSDPSPTPFAISVAGDTTLPVITIISPAAGETISGIVPIEVSAADNVGISKVVYYIGRESDTTNMKISKLATLTQAPYIFQWDTTKEKNYPQCCFLYVYVYDTWNNSATKNWIPLVSNPTSTPTPTATPTPIDTIPPTVAITSPLAGSRVSGIVTIEASASDNVGVAKVEIYGEGGGLLATRTIPPYTASWDTTILQNGNRSIYAYAYDARNNSATTSNIVKVQNTQPTPTSTLTPTSTPVPSDTSSPSTPTGLTITSVSYNQVNLNWTASTDNVGVVGYWVIRNGVTISSSTTTSFSDSTVNPATNYTYQVVAFDAMGNSSSASTSTSVTTPPAPDTQPPTAPTNLIASAVSSSQINLSWNPSSDNIGVTGYDVYRDNVKITTVNTTSFGDTGLSAATAYTYFVIALDNAGNVSPNSSVASATTQPQLTVGNITGTVSNSSGAAIAGAKVATTVNGAKRTFYTNAQGIYTFTGLAPGTYTVTFSAKGYANLKTSVIVTAGVTTINNVTLTKQGGR